RARAAARCRRRGRHRRGARAAVARRAGRDGRSNRRRTGRCGGDAARRSDRGARARAVHPVTDLAAFAAIGLPAAPPVPAVSALDADQWRELLDDIVDERLTGLVVAGCERGAVEMRDDQFEALLVAHEDAMVATLRLESLLLVVQRLLRERSLDVR